LEGLSGRFTLQPYVDGHSKKLKEVVHVWVAEDWAGGGDPDPTRSSGCTVPSPTSIARKNG
jgi:hypothetical protein